MILQETPHKTQDKIREVLKIYLALSYGARACGVSEIAPYYKEALTDAGFSFFGVDCERVIDVKSVLKRCDALFCACEKSGEPENSVIAWRVFW